MAWITLRQFAWTERPAFADAYPEVDGVHRVAADRLLPIDITHVVAVNALAAGPVRYETRQHELRMVLSYLNLDQDEAMSLRDEPFRASSPHIRRFVSESIGLGMLTATLQAAYALHGAAALIPLPTVLAGHVSATKTRPDLLFDGVVLAGEARGRSEPPPTRVTTQQRERLNSLLPWSHHHGTHPIAMTWAYATGRGVTVDLFTRSGRLPGMSGPVGQPLPSPAAVQPELFEQDELGTWTPKAAEPRSTAKARDYDRTSPTQLVTTISGRVNDIANQLYDTAPEPDPPIYAGDHPIRGDWVALDLLGPSTGSFLLGVLPKEVSGNRLIIAVTTDGSQPWQLAD
ncbi:hypothetical protein GCM10029964_037860 [Kibdelosporangium lantanae]